MKHVQWIGFGAATLAVTALFGWGAVAGAEEVMGIVAREGEAAVYAVDQPGVTDEVTVGKVVAPKDSWVVVHLDKGMGMPGERVGYARVKAGVTEDVRVKLEGDRVTEKLLVAVHQDRGKRGEIEFDMDNMEHSPDKPYYVNGHEVATSLLAKEFGIIDESKTAMVMAEAQPGAKAELMVDKAVAPTGAWVVVHLEGDDGMPGERVGLARIPAGESKDVKVSLDPKAELTDNLLVAIHADRGEAGKFEFDMEDRVNSADQPFFVDGKEVATKVRIVQFGVDVEMGEAAIEAVAQMGAEESLKVGKVVAPADSWVVVHLEGPDGMPGARVGYAPVKAGESTDVNVELDPKVGLTPNLLVAVHADREATGEFEFDMDKPLDSPDQPYFVDGMEVATVVPVAEFGVKAEMDQAAIEADHQLGAEKSIKVARAVSPTDAWVVVHAEGEMGMPGERIGFAKIGAGENRDVEVTLDSDAGLTEKLIIAIHADRGTTGEFEFDMDDKVGSPDQPFFVDGMEVATVIEVR